MSKSICNWRLLIILNSFDFSVLIQDSNDEVKNVSGKLDARFLPEDLSKLTSVEVERIFVSNIIYDDSKDTE